MKKAELEHKLNKLDEIERNLLLSIIDIYAETFVCLAFPDINSFEEKVIDVRNLAYKMVKKFGFSQYFSKEAINMILGGDILKHLTGSIKGYKKLTERTQLRVDINERLIFMVKSNNIAHWFNNVEVKT